MKSGVYAMRLRAGPGIGLAEEHIVFFVRPKSAKARLALLIPTASYMAYGNWSDGNGVCYSSYRRPIVNMRPKHRISSMGVTWQFPADLSILAWLEHKGYDYEVLTDEDLHREGLAALKTY